MTSYSNRYVNKFLLYHYLLLLCAFHSSSSQSPIQVHLQNLSHSLFSPKLPLKILIHGFNGSRDCPPNREVRPVLLQTQPVHVLSVDYADLVRVLCFYPWAVYNTRIVSKCLAQLIDELIATHIYEREELHLIGFSLGAQVAGLTANYAKTRLKRITGLDPARPGFMTYNLSEKLDSTDADFVDVIHTDPTFFAYLAASGHADFYPNFGLLHQTGCTYWQNGRLINCDHYRASIYYAESITSPLGFWSFNCGDWLEFLLQRCVDYGHIPHENMGYFVSENASGSYFLSTHGTAPYAKGPLVQVELEVIEIQKKKPVNLMGPDLSSANKQEVGKAGSFYACKRLVSTAKV